MSKIVPLKDFGIPVPAPAPAPDNHLIVYYGAQGFTPNYSQPARIDVGAVSSLTIKTVNSVNYWDDPIGTELPSGLVAGQYDFYFTLMDANGNEGDFSPKVTALVDTNVPPTLGQPVQLG
jgi:hypothetical protein